MDLDDPKVLIGLQSAVDRLREHAALKERIQSLESRQRDDHRHMRAAQGIVNTVLGEPRERRSEELQKAIDHYHDETDLE